MGRILIKAPKKKPAKKKTAAKKTAPKKTEAKSDVLAQLAEKLGPEKLQELLSAIGGGAEEEEAISDKPKFRGGATEFDTKRDQRRRSALPGTTMQVGRGHGQNLPATKFKDEWAVNPETGEREKTGKVKVAARGRTKNILSEMDRMSRESKEKRAEGAKAAKRTRLANRGLLRDDEDKGLSDSDNPPIAHIGSEFGDYTSRDYDWKMDYDEEGNPIRGTERPVGRGRKVEVEGYDSRFPLHESLFQTKRNFKGEYNKTEGFQRHNSLSNILGTMALNHPEEAVEWLQIPGLDTMLEKLPQLTPEARNKVLPHIIDAMTQAVKADPEMLQEQGLRLAQQSHMREFGTGGVPGPMVNLKSYINRATAADELDPEVVAQEAAQREEDNLSRMISGMDIPDTHIDEFKQQLNEMMEDTGMSQGAAAKRVASRMHSVGFEEEKPSTVYDDDKVFEGRKGSGYGMQVPPAMPTLGPEGRDEQARRRAESVRRRAAEAKKPMTLGDFMTQGMEQPHLQEDASEAPPLPPEQKVMPREDDDEEIQLSYGYTSLGERLLKSILEDMLQRT